jgi:hypothetical protein
VRSLDFRSEPVPDDLSCVARAVMACGRQYQGQSFGYCLVGMMVGNSLLPAALMGELTATPLDTSGAFQTGMRLDCTEAFRRELYPPMSE